MKPIKTRHCDECRFHKVVIGNELACEYDHKPRWYSPKSPMDQNYGWKRKCAEYRPIIIKATGATHD